MMKHRMLAVGVGTLMLVVGIAAALGEHESWSNVVIVFKTGEEKRALSVQEKGDVCVAKLPGGIKTSYPVDQIERIRSLTREERQKDQQLVARLRAQWLEAQYEYFRDKLDLRDGQYDTAVPGWYAARKCTRPGLMTAIWPETERQPTFERVGRARAGVSAALIDAQITQVLDPTTALLRAGGNRYGFDRTTYHVSGLNLEELTDGTNVRDFAVVVTGTYAYTTVAGAQRTVMSLRTVSGLSREDFKALLGRARTLERWSPGQIRCLNCRGLGVHLAGEHSRQRGQHIPCEPCKGRGSIAGVGRSFVRLPPSKGALHSWANVALDNLTKQLLAKADELSIKLE